MWRHSEITSTGYSSLSYLEQLPVDALKIDASFTRRITPGAVSPSLVQAIIGLAHNLGMSVIAEGIETQYQMEVLRDLGCDRGQGYWFSLPVAADSAAGILGLPGVDASQAETLPCLTPAAPTILATSATTNPFRRNGRLPRAENRQGANLVIGQKRRILAVAGARFRRLPQPEAIPLCPSTLGKNDAVALR
jgi:EAL domain